MQPIPLKYLLYHASFCGYESRFLMETQPDNRLSPRDAENYREAAQFARQIAAEFNLDCIDAQVDRVLSKLDAGGTYGEVGKELDELRLRIHDQLDARLCLHIPQAKAKYYREALQIGREISGGYPDAEYDGAEAARCYALGRNTACVFHLMRVLESGLTRLAQRFGLSLDHSNWHPVIDQLQNRVADMAKDPGRPVDWRDQQEFFSQCVSYLLVVKNAWRNYTAHARGKYDEQEAWDILAGVRGFMQKLAGRLPDPQQP